MCDWSDCGPCGEKISWELLGDELFIDGEGKMDDYLPNKSIWEDLAFLVRSVSIGRGVTSIGNYAFWSFPALKKISIPSTVTEIGEGAFPEGRELPEITGDRRPPRYFAHEGILFDRFTDLPAWPPTIAGKYISRFAVNEDDCVFRIVTGRHSEYGSSGIACFGDENTLIEIRESGGTIIDIECIYLEPTLHEPNLFLPDYRSDPELQETESFYCPDYEYEKRQLCLVNVVRDRMEIVLSEKLESVCRYRVEGRVEYYCDEEGDVVVIRVSDLTEEEFTGL